VRKILLAAAVCITSNLMAQIQPNIIDSIIATNPLLQKVVAQKDKYRLQIVYTKIDRNKRNVPSFTRYSFNENNNAYFYPASTVKMPTAILALEKLNSIAGINKHTTMYTDSLLPYQEQVFTDITSETKKPSIAHYVKKIFLTSDNDANNRLYEFVGQEYLNNRLQELGCKNSQILHRLSISLQEIENRTTNQIRFLNKKNKLLYQQAQAVSNLKYQQRKDSVGIGYYKGDKLINEPLNFSTKNKFVLGDLTDMLLKVIFPKQFDANKQIQLKKSDYNFLLRCMSQYPSESIFPKYDTAGEVNDTYCKFLYYGSERVPVNKNIRIFNKIGVAYGFVTDIAYIIDAEKNIEFALSATIYVNDDEILNDDKYGYETTGYPFMRELGKAFYQYETTRQRANKPNLSAFKLDYNF
jgi:Beta-lactamase enzyme family